MGRCGVLVAALGVGVAWVGAFAGPASGERAGSGVRAFQAGLLDAGSNHSCAVLHDGSASCWGEDGSGQLGDDAVNADQSSPVAVALPAGRRAVAISAGAVHSCAVLDDGSASCWGNDGNGRLGDDAVSANKATPAAVALAAGRRAAAISAGGGHSCAVLDDGSASCWGNDGNGQLGDDAALADKSTPVAVALPGRRAVAISAGSFHSCAVLDDGSASCWGSDSFGELGDDAVNADKSTPVAVALPAGRRAVAISAGNGHSCALLDDGSASCWGRDNVGQLGDDALIADKSTPVAVALPVGRRAVAISAGGFHTCAVLDDGSARCSGNDLSGQLGDDAVLVSKPTPVAVALPAGRRAVAISAGDISHSCALLDDGSASCWGSDAFGRLGNGLDGTLQPVAQDAPAALPAASSVGRVADLSLTLEGAPGVLAVGAGAAITARLRNDGPDPANATRVLLNSSLLALTPGLIGQGALAGSSWQAGTLAAGAQTTLALNATAVAAGSASLTAEVAGQSERDPDSTPANDIAGEDDQASAQITVPTPPAAAGPPAAGPPPAIRARVDRLTLKLATRRAKRAPYRVKLSGRLIATTVSARAGCTGSITLSARTATKTLATKTAKLRLRDGVCHYTATLTITRKQRGSATSVKLSARFPGNSALLTARSTATRLRLG